MLFALLLTTLAVVWIGGNLLLLDAHAAAVSSRIVATCVATSLILFAMTRLTGSIAWGLTSTYVLLLALVHSRASWAVHVFYVLAAAAAVFATARLRVPKRDMLALMCLAVLAAVVVLGCKGAYTSFDMLRRLHAGDVHQDTLFHAAIAAMIKNYGVASTGLHGLVETPYHTLSHTLMAAFSRISGIGVIEVYGVVNWVLFAPILIFCISATCVALSRDKPDVVQLAWGLAAICLATAPFLLRRWAIWDSFFVSESYLVSLGLFVAGSTLLYKRCLGISDVLLVGLLASLMSNAKASVGVVFAVLFAARIFFVRSQGKAWDISAFIVVMLSVTAVVMESASANTGTIGWSHLHFIQNYSFLGKSIGSIKSSLSDGALPSATAAIGALLAVLGFLLLHYALSWIVAYGAWRQVGIAGLLRSPSATYSLIAVVTGVPIVLFLAIPGGSAYYFSNVAFFVALPIVILQGAEWIDRSRMKRSRQFINGLAACMLMTAQGLHSGSIFDRHRDQTPGNELIRILNLTREALPTEVLLHPKPGELAHNPVKRCSAKPFLFPAVSERPWTDVIVAGPEGCDFENYGYDQYRLSGGRVESGMVPIVLPGMRAIESPR